MTGLPRTSGGQSHSCVTPTSSSARPMAQTISVADGSRDTIRISGLRRRRRDTRDAAVPAVSGAGLELVDAGSGGGLVRVPGGVDHGVLGPLGWQGFLGEDRVDRAFRFAGAAVDALVRVDE